MTNFLFNEEIFNCIVETKLTSKSVKVQNQKKQLYKINAIMLENECLQIFDLCAPESNFPHILTLFSLIYEKDQNQY